LNQEYKEPNEKDANGTEQLTDDESDKKRTIHITISGLTQDEYERGCVLLRERASYIISGVSTKISVTDAEGTDIRKRDGW